MIKIPSTRGLAFVYISLHLFTSLFVKDVFNDRFDFPPLFKGNTEQREKINFSREKIELYLPLFHRTAG